MSYGSPMAEARSSRGRLKTDPSPSRKETRLVELVAERRLALALHYFSTAHGEKSHRYLQMLKDDKTSLPRPSTSECAKYIS